MRRNWPRSEDGTKNLQFFLKKFHLIGHNSVKTWSIRIKFRESTTYIVGYLCAKFQLNRSRQSGDLGLTFINPFLPFFNFEQLQLATGWSRCAQIGTQEAHRTGLQPLWTHQPDPVKWEASVTPLKVTTQNRENDQWSLTSTDHISAPPWPICFKFETWIGLYRGYLDPKF